MRRYVIFLFSFLVAFLFIWLSCAKQQAEQQGEGAIEVSFWHAMAGKHAEVINEFVRDFQALHPQIKVSPIYQGAYDQLSQKLIASLTAGKAPTMAQMYESWATRFIRRDLLEPAQKFIDGPDGFTPQELEDIVKVFREECSRNGQMYTIPFNKSDYVLFVNLDLLNQAGFDKPPETWQEMAEMAQKSTRRQHQRTEVYGFATRPFIESLTTLLYMNGGRYMNDNQELVFNSKEAREALQFLVDLIHRQKAAYAESDYLSSPFGSQRVAMFIGSSAGYPYVEKAVLGKFDWTIAAIPHPEGKKGRVLFQGTNIGIFKDRPDEEKLAAWRFLKFMTNTKNATKWAILTGYVPIRYSVLKTPEMQEHLSNNPRYQVIVEQTDYGIFEPREPYWETMRTAITDEVDAALSGRKTVDQALNEAYVKCQRILKTAKKIRK